MSRKWESYTFGFAWKPRYLETNSSLLSKNKLPVRIMHQSIETPTPWVPGKGRGFDSDPGQKASISLLPEAGVQIKRPYPWGKKDENIKTFKEKTCI